MVKLEIDITVGKHQFGFEVQSNYEEDFDIMDKIIESVSIPLESQVDVTLAETKREVDIELHFFKRTSPQWKKALSANERKIMNEDVEKLSKRICGILSKCSD